MPGFEPGIRALQAPALPLGHIAMLKSHFKALVFKKDRLGQSPDADLRVSMERKTGFEPATPTLARLCSTN